jgi:hypothetical protein
MTRGNISAETTEEGGEFSRVGQVVSEEEG